MVDINDCTACTLASVTGIKREVAVLIVNYRKREAKIESFDELSALKGVTKVVLRKIKSKCIIGTTSSTHPNSNTKTGKNVSAKPIGYRSLSSIRKSARKKRLSGANKKETVVTKGRKSTDTVPNLNLSKPLHADPETKVKLFSPISLQASQSGNMITTVYQCVPGSPQPNNRKRDTAVPSKAQPPSLDVSPSPPKYRKRLSPNKEISIRNWLSGIPRKSRTPVKCFQNASRNNRIRKNRDVTPKHISETVNAVNHLKTCIESTKKKKTGEHERSIEREKYVSKKRFITKASSTESINGDKLDEGSLCVNDFHEQLTETIPNVKKVPPLDPHVQIVEHHHRTTSDKDRQARAVIKHNENNDDDVQPLSPMPGKSILHKDTTRKSYVHERSCSPVESEYRDPTYSPREARRSLWKDREEWRYSRRKGSHKRDDRHRKDADHSDQPEGSCIIL